MTFIIPVNVETYYALTFSTNSFSEISFLFYLLHIVRVYKMVLVNPKLVVFLTKKCDYKAGLYIIYVFELSS